MKKIALLSAMGCIAFGAFAQSRHTSDLSSQKRTREMDMKQEVVKKHSKYQSMAFAKTTATPFQTFDFAGGTASTLPTGWTAGTDGSVPQAATWKWRDMACTGQYNIGTINSTSAANGWLVYDSDSIGAANPTVAPVQGWVQSPVINCTGHSTVQINFQQYYKSFNDSSFVDVSNDNGTTWVTYSVAQNNALATNAFLPSNPTITQMNISATAANQASVLVRFRSKFMQAGGGYNWLIDDVALSELDSVEAGVDGGGTVMATGFGDTTSFGSIPKQFIIDTLLPVVFLDNNGANNLSNVTVTGTVYNGSTLVNTQNATVASLVSGAMDQAVWFNAYNTNATGVYTTAYSVSPTGDVFTSNNVDSATFVVSDSIYHRYAGMVSTAYRIHSKASAPDPERSFQIGTLFEIGPNKTDTLTAVEACFSRTSTANSNVRAIVYKESNGTWNRIKISNQKTLTINDLSNDSAYVFAHITMPANTIISSGNYVVVISGDNVPAGNDVLLLAADPAGSDKVDLLVGVADTSLNNPVSNSFTLGGLGSSSPLVRLVFGNTGTTSNPPGAVNDINVAQVGDAYPNPTNNVINIPFTMTETANVNVTVTNAVGATVVSQNLGKYNANQKGLATFSVTGFANGIYFYTVEANGVKTTKRFVITR
jgi:hypothetical protein